MIKNKQQNTTSNYISNYISIILVYFLRMLVPFLIIVLIGRFYSVEEFGRYAVATAFMSVLGLFLTFGTANVTSFEIAALKKQEKHYHINIAGIMKTCLIILLLFSFAGIVLIGFILSLLNYSKEITHIIIALFFGYFFMAFNSVLNAVFIGIKEMKWIIPSMLANLAAVLIFVIPIIFYKKPLYLIALLWSLSQFTGIIVSAYYLKRNNLLLWPKTSRSNIVRLIIRATGVGLDNVIYRLGINLTNIILPFFLSELEIGVFNGAFKPFILLIAGNQVTIQFFIPYLASRVNDPKEEKERILQIFHKINVFFTFSFIILPLFFSGLLNKIFFGDKLQESISLMATLTVGYLIYYLPPYSAPLKAFKLEWKVIYASICQVSINLLAIIFLVPRYGIKGAVYAVILAFISYWLVNIFLYSRERLKPISNVFKYFLFISFSLINGYIIQKLFDQKIFSLPLFLLINIGIAALIFFSHEERNFVLSILKIKHERR